MKKQIKIIGLWLLVMPFTSLVKSQNFNRLNEWKHYRHEIYGGMGPSNFLGDLGGLNQIGTNRSPVDMEVAATRVAVSAGYKYRITKWVRINAAFNYLALSGDDKLTNEPFRNNRNINFKSNVFEISTRIELSYISTLINRRLSLKQNLSSRFKSRVWDITAFVGIGSFYFNPKGKLSNGKWVNLREMHTEGQGLPGGPAQYSNYSICIPIGFSYHYCLNKTVNIGFEFSFRKTFTDYIDDVSTVYYDKNAIRSAYGADAAYLADPSKGLIPGQTNSGNKETGAVAQMRGNSKQKDSYMSLQFTVGYMIRTPHLKVRLRSKF